MQAIKILSPVLLVLALVGCNKEEKTAAPATEPTPAVTASSSASTASATATAPASDMTADQHITAREDIMGSFGGVMKSMRGMTEDPSKFNADEVKKHAETLSQDPWGHFPETAKGGSSKDEVWTQPDQFKAEIDKFKTAVEAFKTASQNATSIDAVKAQFGEVGASCKSCHTAFKLDN